MPNPLLQGNKAVLSNALPFRSSKAGIA